MRIAISAESTIDLQKSLLKEYDIKIIPFTLVLGEETHLDGDLSCEELFAFTDKTGNLPHTSAVNPAQYHEHFEKLLEDHDAIIHFSLSSTMSSAFQNACLVAASLGKEIYCIDSASLSTGIALLAVYARKLVNEGKEAKEIVELVKKRVPFVQASFSLESVNYLYKGGRCSTLSFLGANLLHLKPQIYVRNGSMVPARKDRGPMLKVVMNYVEDTLRLYNNPDYENVFLTYSTAPEEVLQAVETRLKEAGFKKIMRTTANGTISSHCGPHCLGILYINDGAH